ncbi:possible acetyltransferase (GNAT) family protein [Pseudooceanicola batsensis HTCC2597]|uniref:Possible acetyltransferase (GNAT) family protein n=1 Tax=Pseudooceanicola batsensis (strain ATCC BAA-863 / DSM 15984 / KCTC 12145 / HTCC2597) TaxID=252305 RepID=A3TVD2_PSEBH|nr:GNAT family N-acetyltransferase [Pseudooceanicola batsensis]EAQ04478.1 possible acetyltransferase (GNAT) family protein [Pseudooceanicola batsensis HTCC2597]
MPELHQTHPIPSPCDTPRDGAVVRAAMPADTEGVGRLLARSYRALLAPDYAPATLKDALPLIALANPRLLSCGTYYVLERDDRILAAGGWTDSSPHGTPGRRGVGHVRHVAVDPEVVRQGLGARLMACVLGSARSAGVVDLRCQSTLTAAPFYASLGFEAQGRIDVRLPTGVLFPAIQMRRFES